MSASCVRRVSMVHHHSFVCLRYGQNGTHILKNSCFVLFEFFETLSLLHHVSIDGVTCSNLFNAQKVFQLSNRVNRVALRASNFNPGLASLPHMLLITLDSQQNGDRLIERLRYHS